MIESRPIIKKDFWTRHFMDCIMYDDDPLDKDACNHQKFINYNTHTNV